MKVDLKLNRDRDLDMASTHIPDTTMGGVTTSTTTAYATPPPTSTPTGPIDWGKRRDEVKAGFVHAMKEYKTHAFPHDKLLAVSGKFSDKFNGWGVTLLDSLDTMYIMGLHDDFEDALGFVGNLTFSMPQPPTPTSSTRSSATSAASSQHTHTPPPSYAQRLTWEAALVYV
ncbi:1,2-alpha-mannosidase [Laccaria bicolor S238N-H82]|uniref:alpha-1,2-Mannosidase n=1 Tax=Laccaria bicolor (strain S238N-H82 / ATCC MYA-4686) TaxID=486041 RepID=B0E165_LACBS|nr:1,2-alpha-mannosidase [Laccaria bicolor S238N-H82]EDQ99403.1 1,2-alpha-mannosidase [Laccaria bicolor S238N-H82]|eukprot:XP_001889954.1 1,2-alpha-mannosidase [Laccaria bicolor S238N-H82]